MERYQPGCKGWLIRHPRGGYWYGRDNTWGSLSGYPAVYMTKAGAKQAFTGSRAMPKGYRIVRVSDAERDHIEDLRTRSVEIEERLSTATEPGNEVGQIGWLESIQTAINDELTRHTCER